MGLHRDKDEGQWVNELNTDPNYDEDRHDYDAPDKLQHKREVRKMLEERLERKRLKAELDDELEGEFDWDDFER